MVNIVISFWQNWTYNQEKLQNSYVFCNKKVDWLNAECGLGLRKKLQTKFDKTEKSCKNRKYEQPVAQF